MNSFWKKFTDGKDVPALELLTLQRYMFGMLFQGVWWAGYVMLPFVLGKSLGAPGWLITVVVTMDTAGMLLALYWGHLMAAGGRRRGLFWGGLLGRFILVLMPLSGSIAWFVVLVAMVNTFTAILYPAMNGIFQANIHPDRQGRYFGYGAFIQHTMVILSSLVIGKILSNDPTSYQYIYPVIGICGFVYMFILARLPRPEDDKTPDPEPWSIPKYSGKIPSFNLLLKPFQDARNTFSIDKSFLWYEMNFMLYGFAFMMLSSVVPLYFINKLNLGYDEITNARLLIASAGVALFGPLMGKLLDKYKPATLCCISFTILGFYPIALLAAEGSNWAAPVTMAYIAFAVYSLGMSGVNVAWHIGSISFAPKGEGGYYQGIHVAMVGVRGIFGPLVGYLVMKIFGYYEAFAVTAVLFWLAAISSFVMGRKK
ncbi:MAG: MFS transporter [bacterium]|nr:MFS transporter [bacterium]MCP4800471.1 MFS transporter [bacterium]